jgi:magnesium-transporting ATPase (P-type)
VIPADHWYANEDGTAWLIAQRCLDERADLPAHWKEDPPDNADLCCDCIVGIIDPLRSDVKEAVATAQRAGVTVRMVTGDNMNTARAIARNCGILTASGTCIEGPVYRNLTPAMADEQLKTIQVMARSSPEDKFLLVTRLNGYGLPSNKEEWEEKHMVLRLSEQKMVT